MWLDRPLDIPFTVIRILRSRIVNLGAREIASRSGHAASDQDTTVAHQRGGVARARSVMLPVSVHSSVAGS